MKGEKKFEFSFEKVKHVIGEKNNYLNFVNIIKNYFYKLAASEYEKENENETVISINDRNIDLRNYVLLNLNSYFDLIGEYKLPQKSLLYRTMEIFINKEEYNEEMQTINILMNDFLNKIIDDFESSDILLTIDDIQFDAKMILSNINISFVKESCKTNQKDYSIEEMAKIKEKLFHYLIKNSFDKEFVIIDEVGLLKIEEYLDYSNVFIITNDDKFNKLEDIYDLDKKIDYGDENFVYELFMNSEKAYDFELYKTELYKSLKE